MLSAVLAAPPELKHDKDVEVYTEQDLTTVRYSGDGRRVAAASFDGGITMWDSRWFRTTAECNPGGDRHEFAAVDARERVAVLADAERVDLAAVGGR